MATNSVRLTFPSDSWVLVVVQQNNRMWQINLEYVSQHHHEWKRWI